MDITALLALPVLAVAVGVGVSMDVSGYNLSMAGNKEYSATPVKHSLLHAFWHGLFLSLGIGLIAILATSFQWLLTKYNLAWVFEWVTSIFTWLRPNQVVIWILAIAGVVLWLKLYWDKLRGEEEDEHVPGWLKWFLNLFRVPVAQLSYVLVAVDMWFLTPLLKALVEKYSLVGKMGFVAIVFATVFLCSFVSIKYGQRFLGQKNTKGLFFWLVALVFLEPMITGYFGGRTVFWIFTGTWDNNVSLVFLSAFVVMLLSLGKFNDIIDDKWAEATEAIHGDEDDLPFSDPATLVANGAR